MDELIKKYSEILQKIYDNRTAGDHTFVGVLADFEREKILFNDPVRTALENAFGLLNTTYRCDYENCEGNHPSPNNYCSAQRQFDLI